MKIEMGESLGYSYLRHVRNCWLVQTNWKASEHWEKQCSDEELETTFRSMRHTFDLGGSVFKGTRDSGQFLRQAEVDVVGVGQDGSIHAIDVAFHEAGLNYGGGVGNRVLKKMLRTVLVLMAYHPPEVQQHIYFVSPRVHRAAQQPLENIFDRLREEYGGITWHLLTNETFANEMLVPTLEKGESVADTAELFLRAHKLLELGEQSVQATGVAVVSAEDEAEQDNPRLMGDASEEQAYSKRGGKLQDIVRELMATLLEDFPALLGQEELEKMKNANYCRNLLGLNISNLPLLRDVRDGRDISGRSRYWRRTYGGRFYVTSQWWQDHHLTNAKALMAIVSTIIQRNEGHPGATAIQRHWHELNDYVRSNQ